jgi:hypothetical protein
MKPKPRRLTLEPTELEIQHAAFLLWEEQGRPAGRDLEIWLAAKERLKHAVPIHDEHARQSRDPAYEPEDVQTATAGLP